VTDPEQYNKQYANLQQELWLVYDLILHYPPLRPLVGAALAAAPPATLDALGEWITQPVPSAAEVEPKVVLSALSIAACAASCNKAAAAALASRRSVVRALVAAVVIATSPGALEDKDVDISSAIRNASYMLVAMMKASSENVMLALAAGQPGSGRDGDDLLPCLRELLEAAVAGGDLRPSALKRTELILAVLAGGQERIKMQADQQQQQQQQQPQQQQQQQPGGSRACAGCGKTAADEGAAKLRRCNGCPRGSALRFCSVACQKAVWVGGHRQECPRLDTAAQRGEQQ